MRDLRVLFYETPENPYYSLAFEEALMYSVEKTNTPILRFWRHRNAVIIGYFQKAEEEVNMDYAREIGASIVRRFTGGGAVYHDLGCLLWTIATKGPGDGGVSYLYNFLLKGFVNALRKLGLDASVENVNDVIVSYGGRTYKVSGAAGSFRKDTYLLHGTLLISTNLETLSKILRVSRAKLADKKISDVKYRVVNISSLKEDVRYSDIVKAVIDSYSELLDANPYLDLPSAYELELARRLYEAKYSRPEWNLLRMPSRIFRVETDI
ncbi:lipoate--protein ligase family protein [Thermogladius sp. 4427co]|uniref:lipoate--protein ligase family protein n=1 Tax=Thermogladius sp. 4427co TaxID=3450718 RepID=UPI003F7A7E0A